MNHVYFKEGIIKWINRNLVFESEMKLKFQIKEL
jgi:hypothetical protein